MSACSSCRKLNPRGVPSTETHNPGPAQHAQAAECLSATCHSPASPRGLLVTRACDFLRLPVLHGKPACASTPSGLHPPGCCVSLDHCVTAFDGTGSQEQVGFCKCHGGERCGAHIEPALSRELQEDCCSHPSAPPAAHPCAAHHHTAMPPLQQCDRDLPNTGQVLSPTCSHSAFQQQEHTHPLWEARGVNKRVDCRSRPRLLSASPALQAPLLGRGDSAKRLVSHLGNTQTGQLQSTKVMFPSTYHSLSSSPRLPYLPMQGQQVHALLPTLAFGKQSISQACRGWQACQDWRGMGRTSAKISCLCLFASMSSA